MRHRPFLSILVLALVVAGTCAAPVGPGRTAQAGPAGAWTTVASMGTSRFYHTVTRMNDGRVLAAGGFTLAAGSTSAVNLDSAEVYDPVANSWTPTNPLTSTRQLHTAVTLGNGKVLIAGGQSGPFLVTATELYDPATNSFTSTGDMAVGRWSHTMVRLQNGRVLVAGGDMNAATAEVYNPGTGTWTPTGRMRSRREGATATLLADGRVLVAGGFRRDTNITYLASAEIYDPATNAWTATGPMTVRRMQAAAVRIAGGRVLVSGGSDGSGFQHETAEIFDPATGTWTATGALGREHGGHALIPLPTSYVLAAGGDTPLDSRVYNTATGEWLSLGSRDANRTNGVAVALSGGRALVAGGLTVSGGTSAMVEVFTFTANEMPEVTPPTIKVLQSQLGLNTNGALLKVQVEWAATDIDGIERFELQRRIDAGTWTDVPLGNPTNPMRGMSLSVSHTHQFRVRATDTLGATSAYVPGPTWRFMGGQESAPAVTYIGRWRQIAASGAWGGEVKRTGWSSLETRGAQITFTGNGIVWVATMGPQYGMVELRLDGIAVGTFDLYAPRAAVTRQVIFGHITRPTTHTLDIVVLSNANPASTGKQVDFDGFIVIRTR